MNDCLMKLTENPDWLKELPQEARLETKDGPVQVRTQRMGALRLPSGRIVACDPALVDVPPLERTVPAGEYPTTAVYIVYERDDDTRVAAACIDFAPGAICSWEPAVPEGVKEHVRRRGRAHGLGVDSAIASFMSAEACEHLNGPRKSELTQVLADADREERSPTCWWGLARLPGAEGLNVALFSAGNGDGRYPVFWGLSDTGAAIRLVTDFLLVRQWRGQTGISLRPWWRLWR